MSAAATFRTAKSDIFYVWPVSPGDIGVVPMPPAVWLFGSALGLMGAMRRIITEKFDV